MKLSNRQRAFFRKEGYVMLPGLISPAYVRQARRAINISVGQGMNVEDMPRLRVQSFCPELRDSAPLMSLLLQTGLRSLSESLIGEGELRPGSQGGAQINLRFPVHEGVRKPLLPHLDGMSSPTNAVPPGHLRNFTALVGVLLSDVLEEDEGNFTVWPGTHLLNADYLQRVGARKLLDGMPDIALPPPLQLTGRAGDVVIAHYLLSHGTAASWGCDVRYMAFFRLTHVRHDHDQWQSLEDPWRQWPGIRRNE